MSYLGYTVSVIALVISGAVYAPLATADHHAEMPSSQPPTNDYWWPERLDLSPLRQNAVKQSPLNADFDYAAAYESIDQDQLKKDMIELMTTSQDWWPADYGHYGPFFIRMTWHAAGTYRTTDGRGGADGGMQRFAPLNSWPDNANLDKARRLLWPIKQKYGRSLSWSDLIAMAGNVAMESMGFKTYGFAGGRRDAWQASDVNWGPEGEWLASNRHAEGRRLDDPLAATRMGLIYVNPEGPDGNPDPLLAARDIRTTFARMAMNDEETVALIAGGHTFGKMHGAATPQGNVGAEPEKAPLEQMGLGWKSNYKTGSGEFTITSGLEGAWTVSPAEWTHNYFQNLFGFEWELTESPAGAKQWQPTDKNAFEMVPDAHNPDIRHAPVMLTTDLALIKDPAYRKISEKFLDDPDAFEVAYAKAWFKLIHRDMGPRSRYLGNDAPAEAMIWQDPVPERTHRLISGSDIKKLKKMVKSSDLTTSQLVKTAWASASSFRNTDMRGGANGARIMLAPQKSWKVNDPTELTATLSALSDMRDSYNETARRDRKISMADMIVLAGAAAVEQAAAKAGYDIVVPFVPGRTDATQDMTDAASFNALKPHADAFRNYYHHGMPQSPVDMMVEKAAMLDLTVPEMTILVGGMRVLGANSGNNKNGQLTDQVGTLNNAYFKNLTDLNTVWKKSDDTMGLYNGYDRKTGDIKWTATSVDLIFGANSELRAVSEFYATNDAGEQFVNDFVKAWVKVMQLDRFDLR